MKVRVGLVTPVKDLNSHRRNRRGYAYPHFLQQGVQYPHFLYCEWGVQWIDPRQSKVQIWSRFKFKDWLMAIFRSHVYATHFLRWFRIKLSLTEISILICNWPSGNLKRNCSTQPNSRTVLAPNITSIRLLATEQRVRYSEAGWTINKVTKDLSRNYYKAKT